MQKFYQSLGEGLLVGLIAVGIIWLLAPRDCRPAAVEIMRPVK